MSNLIEAKRITMTSREIAELTNKNHAHVMRDIRALIDAVSMNPELEPCVKTTSYTGRDGRKVGKLSK